MSPTKIDHDRIMHSEKTHFVFRYFMNIVKTFGGWCPKKSSRLSISKLNATHCVSSEE